LGHTNYFYYIFFSIYVAFSVKLYQNKAEIDEKLWQEKAEEKHIVCLLVSTWVLDK
jgi:hypothetical protein